jgi:hypothetical protein
MADVNVDFMDVDIIEPPEENGVVDEPLANAEPHQSTPVRAETIEPHLGRSKKRVSEQVLTRQSLTV